MRKFFFIASLLLWPLIAHGAQKLSYSCDGESDNPVFPYLHVDIVYRDAQKKYVDITYYYHAGVDGSTNGDASAPPEVIHAVQKAPGVYEFAGTINLDPEKNRVELNKISMLNQPLKCSPTP